MLKAGFIKHTVNKTTFSEQCYYTFGDEATIASGMKMLSDEWGVTAAKFIYRSWKGKFQDLKKYFAKMYQ